MGMHLSLETRLEGCWNTELNGRSVRKVTQMADKGGGGWRGYFIMRGLL
jgi:hypothetical protein